MEQWEIVHQWEWFRRYQWLCCFRDTKLLLCEVVTGLLLERGLADGLVLDCSCGLGSQAITFAEAGLRVIGSDRSGFSVSRAAEMARSHALEIEFFHAVWQELPARTTKRFDAAFCDALCWLHTDGEMAAALRGLRGVLRPGGVLIFQGAPEGLDEADFRRDLDAWWASVPGARLNWRHAEGAVSCSALTVPSRGEDYIDWRLLYLIDENGAQRLEHVTLRESMRWNWNRFAEMAIASGFERPFTRAVQAWSPGGRRVALNYAVAAGSLETGSG
jgi:SAM-dependent methyltransferase